MKVPRPNGLHESISRGDPGESLDITAVYAEPISTQDALYLQVKVASPLPAPATLASPSFTHWTGSAVYV